MRHDKVAASGRLDMADIAAVWPASAQIAPVPIPDMEPGPWEGGLLHAPVTDVRSSVRPLIVAICAALLAAVVAGLMNGIF
jgi:hypothetical protein